MLIIYIQEIFFFSVLVVLRIMDLKMGLDDS